jgi:hypothetical protein
MLYDPSNSMDVESGNLISSFTDSSGDPNFSSRDSKILTAILAFSDFSLS